MKKSLLSVCLVLVLALALVAQVPAPAKPKPAPAQPAAAQQAQPPKPEDMLKNLVIVDKVVPPPDRMKAGFEAITAKDSLNFLGYLSSDLLEGRETATRGHQLATGYASSLFAMWKILPAGDTPAPRMPSMMGPGTAPAPAPQRSYLQEFALRDTLDDRP